MRVVTAAMLVPALAPWLAQESIFEFTAREPKNRNPANPGAATPEWRPRHTSAADLEVAEGPPSVS